MVSQDSKHGQLQRCKVYLTDNIACDLLLEAELMMITFATGIMDAVTFPDYHVFASNQTGNTALIAVGALHIGDGFVHLEHVGLSLGAFITGGLVLGQLGNWMGTTTRIWLITTNVFQTILVFAAAALRAAAENEEEGNIDLGIIALLAFASGAQVASARTVHIPEVTTAMVTSAYIDLIVDPGIIKMHNRSRNRRLFFVSFLVLGSFVGAIAYRFNSPALALYVSAISKGLVCIALAFNRKRSCEGTGEDQEPGSEVASGHR